MDFINPWKKKEPSQEEMMAQQHAYDQENVLTQSATYPTDSEYDTFNNKENLMAELTRWQQDLSPMLTQLFNDLAGVSEDNQGRLIPIEGFNAVCSTVAAKRWVDFIKPIDKNVMNGAWTIKQINDAMIEIDDTIAQDLIEHWSEYKIEYSVATFDYICNTIIHAVYPTFLRGLENGERKYHGQIQKVIETKNIVQDKKGKGLFGKE